MLTSLLGPFNLLTLFNKLSDPKNILKYGLYIFIFIIVSAVSYKIYDIIDTLKEDNKNLKKELYLTKIELNNKKEMILLYQDKEKNCKFEKEQLLKKINIIKKLKNNKPKSSVIIKDKNDTTKKDIKNIKDSGSYQIIIN